MGRWRSAVVGYKYKICIDLEGIVNSIMDDLRGEVEDYGMDGEYLEIMCTDTAKAQVWSCAATSESPAEYEVEFTDSIENHDVRRSVVKALRNVKEDIFVTCDVDYESIEEVEELYESDPDREWKRLHGE